MDLLGTVVEAAAAAATAAPAESAKSSSSLSTMEALFTTLLRLPGPIFRDGKVQLALQTITRVHFRMRPLRRLAGLFGAPLPLASSTAAAAGSASGSVASVESAEVTTCRLRALGIATSFLATLTQHLGNNGSGSDDDSDDDSDNSDSAAAASNNAVQISAALGDAASVLPHALSALEHPLKAVRDAAMGFLTAVNDAAALRGALTDMTLVCRHDDGNADGGNGGSGDDDAMDDAGGEGGSAAPRIGAVAFVTLCGQFVSHRMEVSMDARAAANGFGSWLLDRGLNETPTWRKCKAACLEFLLAQSVAVGLRHLANTDAIESDAEDANDNNYDGDDNGSAVAWAVAAAATAADRSACAAVLRLMARSRWAAVR